jgi:mono/diheme cytochrome c family protein
VREISRTSRTKGLLVLRYVLPGFVLVFWTALAVAGVTSKPDSVHGKDLAEKLCTNCHLVGSTQQQQPANVDVPSFHEIADRTARIMLPKHPMPTIPLTKAELADLAAYILSLHDDVRQ